jgi:hypothetical protein
MTSQRPRSGAASLAFPRDRLRGRSGTVRSTCCCGTAARCTRVQWADAGERREAATWRAPRHSVKHRTRRSDLLDKKQSSLDFYCLIRYLAIFSVFANLVPFPPIGGGGVFGQVAPVLAKRGAPIFLPPVVPSIHKFSTGRRHGRTRCAHECRYMQGVRSTMSSEGLLRPTD